MKNVVKRFKTAAVVAAAMMATLGAATNAKALTVNSGDLVFAMYGNNTQLLQNLGQVSSFFAPGSTATINLAPSDVSAVGGTNPVKWALVSYSDDGSVPGASSTKNLSAWTPSELGAISIINTGIAAATWAAQSSGVYPGGPTQLIATSDALSYTAAFGTDGSMASGFPVSTEGFFGSTLAVLQGDVSTNGLVQLGSAMLLADGTLTLSGIGTAPVPVPAAVVLFGTGLAGLVGVARRRLIVA